MLDGCGLATIVGIADPLRVTDDLYPRFATAQELIDSTRPDVVIVSVPHDLYVDIVPQCLGRGVSVLQEKPLGRDVREAERIQAAADLSSAHLAVATQKRHSAAFKYLRAEISQHGPPTSFHYSYHIGREMLHGEWRLSRSRAGGGALLDMGYHVIDVLTALFGQPSNAAVYTTNLRVVPESGLEESVAACVGYPAGTIGSLNIGWYLKPRWESATFWWADHSLVISGGDADVYDKNGRSRVASAESWRDLMHVQWHEYLAWRSGEPVLVCTARDGVETQRALSILRAAMWTNRGNAGADGKGLIDSHIRYERKRSP